MSIKVIFQHARHLSVNHCVAVGRKSALVMSLEPPRSRFSTQPRQPSLNTSSSSKSTAGWREPEYMVSTDPTVDPKVIKVPILTDVVRADIFAKFKVDPNNQWTVSKLAQNFNCSADRIKAVIFLMQKREDMQRDSGVLDIPQVWKNVHEKHLSDPVANTSESLAAEFSLSVEEVGSILTRMDAHHRRQQNADEADADRALVMNRYADRGVDVRFRETATAPRRPGLTDNYFPELFGDDGYESAKNLLLKRVASETMASAIPGMERFLKGPEKGGVTDVGPSPVVAVDTSAAVSHQSSSLSSSSRWKFAFRDLSDPKAKTRIRTRTGRYVMMLVSSTSHYLPLLPTPFTLSTWFMSSYCCCWLLFLFRCPYLYRFPVSLCRLPVFSISELW